MPGFFRRCCKCAWWAFNSYVACFAPVIVVGMAMQFLDFRAPDHLLMVVPVALLAVVQ